MALHIRTADGVDVTCVQIAGLVARRILCYVREGDHLDAGQRYGFIRFGSRVDLYLPATAAAKVSLGDRATAGITAIAELTGLGVTGPPAVRCDIQDPGRHDVG